MAPAHGRANKDSATLEFEEEDEIHNVTFVIGCRNLLFVTSESLMTRKYEDLGSAQTVQVAFADKRGYHKENVIK